MAAKAPVVITIEDLPEAGVVVASLGQLTVRLNGWRIGKAMASVAGRTLTVDYRAFTNKVLSASVDPYATPAAVDRLPKGERRTLMLAVVRLQGGQVEWRGLYGSFLSPDERFFAVMLWLRERRREAFRERLRKLREDHRRDLSRVIPALTAIPSLERHARLVFSESYRKTFAAVNELPWNARVIESLKVNRTLLGVDGALARQKAWVMPDYASTLNSQLINRALSVGALQAFQAGAAGARLGALGRIGETFDASRLRQIRGLNVADTALAALGRPLIDVRTRVLIEGRGIDALFPATGTAVIEAASRLRKAWGPMFELQEAMIHVNAFVGDWEKDPLWFLLGVFGMRTVRKVAGLTRDETHEVILVALSEVVCDGEFVPALRMVLRQAPELNEHQRQWLDHGLEHAAERDWLQAVPPLLTGLEGALHRAAVERGSVKERGGKVSGAEAIVKRMAVEESYRRFVVRRVFGGYGNEFRHGRADSGERAQTLFAVVALAGWIDFVMEMNTVSILAGRLSARLDDAIDQLHSGNHETTFKALSTSSK